MKLCFILLNMHSINSPYELFLNGMRYIQTELIRLSLVGKIILNVYNRTVYEHCAVLSLMKWFLLEV